MLSRIPASFFEAAGTVAGLLCSLTIVAQVYAEWRSAAPSTLSPPYVLGFMMVFLFWTLYGIRFKRMALWLTNGIALVIQTLLLIVVISH